MDYNEILFEIKALFIEKLEQVVKPEAYEANPLIGRHVYLDTVYSDIMALGYNFGDQKKATDDIYEMHSALHGESKESYRYVQIRVAETAMHYPDLIKTFSSFHQKTQSGEDFENVLTDIKSALKKL